MSIEDNEVSFEEVKAGKSSIQHPAIVLPTPPPISNNQIIANPPAPPPSKQGQNSEVPPEKQGNTKQDHEDKKERVDEHPLFSQLRVHILVKGIQLIKGVNTMKDIIVQEYYDKYKVKVVKEDMYLKKLPDGSATAYVGFRYDYEAYKVITSENIIQLPLIDLHGDKGTPKYEITELYRHFLKSSEGLLKEQMRRFYRPSLQNDRHQYEDYQGRIRRNQQQDLSKERRYDTSHHEYYSPPRSQPNRPPIDDVASQNRQDYRHHSRSSSNARRDRRWRRSNERPRSHDYDSRGHSRTEAKVEVGVEDI